MRKLPIIVALFLTIVLPSCRKNKEPMFDGVNCTGNCFILLGKLIDSAANTGIARGELKFYFRDQTGTFSPKKKYLGRAVTDADGNYSFRFDGSSFKNVRGYFFVEAFKDNLFADPSYPNQVGTFDNDTSRYNVPLVQNYPLFRPATVKVRVVASAATTAGSTTVGYHYGKIGYGFVLNGGRSIDTVLTWKTAGDMRTFIEAVAVGNGVNIQKRDTVLVPANGTRQVEIRL